MPRRPRLSTFPGYAPESSMDGYITGVSACKPGDHLTETDEHGENAGVILHYDAFTEISIDLNSSTVFHSFIQLSLVSR